MSEDRMEASQATHGQRIGLLLLMKRQSLVLNVETHRRETYADNPRF
jgi:hypothetical protein